MFKKSLTIVAFAGLAAFAACSSNQPAVDDTLTDTLSAPVAPAPIQSDTAMPGMDTTGVDTTTMPIDTTM